jgi:hypothetical protein
LRKKGEIKYPVLGKKLNWKKNWYRGRGGFSRGGEATEGTPVILIGRGVQGGRGKLSTNV